MEYKLQSRSCDKGGIWDINYDRDLVINAIHQIRNVFNFTFLYSERRSS